MLIPVIMAGGTGSRLWPMSLEFYPKQFLTIHGKKSMLQETIARLEGMNTHNPLIVCNKDHYLLVSQQLRQINKLSKNIILEPVSRNTAPAIALAALSVILNGEDPLLLILTADHIICDIDAFRNTVNTAKEYANNGYLVTFGIVPTSPEISYGYIHRGKEQNSEKAFLVRRFVEKPNKKIATSYVRSGEYYWNSGMFLFRARKYLKELGKYRPDILTACKKSIKHPVVKSTEILVHVNRKHFITCPNDSVDYAVMEKTSHSIVVPLNAGWNDVGSWSSLWKIKEKDENNNATVGNVFLHNTHNSYINSNEKMVAAVGVNNLVIVNTKDALLVIDKNNTEEVKKVVEYLKSCSKNKYIYQNECSCSLCHKNIMINILECNMSLITIKPGGKYSKQINYIEQWIVLSGTAKVILENKSFVLNKNQSTFIQIGSLNMLENIGNIQLSLLEIQSENRLSEKDIIRLKNNKFFK